MRGRRTLTAGVLSTVIALSLTACEMTHRHHHDEDEAHLASMATVDIHQAIETASQKVPGTVVEAKLDKEDGQAIWEVEIITPDGRKVEVHVDAKTGEAHLD
jgi:uncharacterized membrane protein YkoI